MVFNNYYYIIYELLFFNLFYFKGTCNCFEGSWGADCGQVSNAGGRQSNYVFPSHLNYTTAHVVEGN
jgi:hypothetical protein